MVPETEEVTESGGRKIWRCKRLFLSVQSRYITHWQARIERSFCGLGHRRAWRLHFAAISVQTFQE
ncbi:hypothetical protein YC2023_018104 [Brassica napus]